MKKMVLILCLSFGLSVQAGILLEPFVGMTFNGEIDADLDNKVTGTEMGARVAWQTLGFFVGADYRMSDLEIDYDNLGESDFNMSRLSAIVGYDFPILLRAWAGLTIQGSGDGDGSDVSDASGSLLGVGYKGLPFLSVNFEMVNYKFSDVEGSSNDLEGSHYLLSLSFPLTF